MRCPCKPAVQAGKVNASGPALVRKMSRSVVMVQADALRLSNPVPAVGAEQVIVCPLALTHISVVFAVPATPLVGVAALNEAKFNPATFTVWLDIVQAVFVH